jgi:hypothetical protein
MDIEILSTLMQLEGRCPMRCAQGGLVGYCLRDGVRGGDRSFSLVRAPVEPSLVRRLAAAHFMPDVPTFRLVTGTD